MYLHTYSAIHEPSRPRTTTVTVLRLEALRCDTHDDTEGPRELALADANFERLTSCLGAHADDAAAFQMPSDLPLRCRTLSLVTHSDDC